MKKLMLLGCIPLLMAACTGSGGKKITDTLSDNAAQKSVSKTDSSRLLPELITLNGIKLADADTYVMDFINKPSVYNSPTSIWFSKAYLNQLKVLLEKEGADGIRIYFATFTNGHNIAVVSTREVGTDKTHQDYFEHSASFLNTAEAKGTVDYTGKKGATLYDPNMKCPTNDLCNASYSHYLSCGEASDRVRNFTNDKFVTTSEWFDIGVLDNIINELNSTATADGIRIYYARNKSATKDTHGFVVINTKKSATDRNAHDDFYTCSSRLRDLDNGEQCPNNCKGVTWPPQ